MGSLIGFRVIGQIKPLLQPSFSQTGEKRCQYQDDPYFSQINTRISIFSPLFFYSAMSHTGCHKTDR